MSSRDVRPPLRGVIYQGRTIVGGVVLNAPDEPFIQEFNREYKKLGLRVAPQEASSCSPETDIEERATARPVCSGDEGRRKA